MKSSDSMPSDLRPGDNHYRAFVGEPRHYDLVSAITFQILTLMGLREHHSVLDIGCGSLRNARLLIPYLNVGCYSGVEPNQWLVDAGIKYETGDSQITLKQPSFSYRSDLDDFEAAETFDYILAQSVFSHCGSDLMSAWTEQLITHMHSDSLLVGTYYKRPRDELQTGWVYPGLVPYCPDTFQTFFRNHNLFFNEVEWPHPRLQWFVVSVSKLDLRQISAAGEILADTFNSRWHRIKT